MKKLISLVCVLCMVCTIWCGGSLADAKSNYTTIPTKINKYYKGSIYKYSYKRIKINGKSRGVKKINKFLKAKSEKSYKGYKKTLKEWYGYVNKCGHTTTAIDETKSSLKYYSKKYVSIKTELVANIFDQCGCPVFDNCYTFNKKSGKVLKLTDISKKSTSSLKKSLIKKVSQKYGNSNLIFSNYRDTIESEDINSWAFYLKSANKAVIIFDAYSIGAGAMGLPRVTINI